MSDDPKADRLLALDSANIESEFTAPPKEIVVKKQITENSNIRIHPYYSDSGSTPPNELRIQMNSGELYADLPADKFLTKEEINGIQSAIKKSFIYLTT